MTGERGARDEAARLSLTLVPLLIAAVCLAPVLLGAQQPAAVVRPLSITRVLANPDGVPDELGEWIELANTGSSRVELRGWQLRSANDVGVTVGHSLIVPRGARVVLGRSADVSRNGGVAVMMTYTGIALGNRRDWVALVAPDGVTVDSIRWSETTRGMPIGRGGEALDSAAERPTLPPRARAPVMPPIRTSMPLTRDPAMIPGARDVTVRILDVGHGDAVLIQNGGSTVLVDGGPDGDVLGRHLDALGLNDATIDAVILTHAHADHYQGLRELFNPRRRITVRAVWDNFDPSPNGSLSRLRQAILSRARAGSLVSRDTDDPCGTGAPICSLTLRGGARIHIMRPDPGGRSVNNRSVAVKLVGPDSAAFSMWLAGDAERDEIAWFERAGYATRPGMRVDVLKSNHHGSDDGVTDRYLDRLQPSAVVVSMAALNDYGHLQPRARAMYARHRVPWYRTDQNGTVTIRSRGVPGSLYSIEVERGTRNAAGPSDRR